MNFYSKPAAQNKHFFGFISEKNTCLYALNDWAYYCFRFNLRIANAAASTASAISAHSESVGMLVALDCGVSD
jgi:hypothetical protein